ncbi:MAG: holo-ACP synthase [Candidatus Margulisiibacteriota bacterium]
MIGVDIVEINRIMTLVEDSAFIAKVFSDHEVDYCRRTKSLQVSAQRFSVRFAAKEAVFKAVDDLKTLRWREIEIHHEETGKPIVVFSGKTADLVAQKGLEVEVSLSHSRDYAVAVAIIRQGAGNLS